MTRVDILHVICCHFKVSLSRVLILDYDDYDDYNDYDDYDQTCVSHYKDDYFRELTRQESVNIKN